MMARIKIPAAPVFQSWEDVDQALREIAEKEITLMEIEGEMNKQINGVKKSAVLEKKPHEERIATLSKDIESFVSQHRDELVGKTKILNFGRTGFRKASKVIVSKAKEMDIIRALRARKMTKCIRVKESVDKEELRKYDEDTIIEVGAKLKVTDEFWCEADHEKLQSL